MSSPVGAEVEAIAGLLREQLPAGMVVTETAYPYRDEHLVVEMIGSWADGDEAAVTAWVRDTERRLDAHALPGGWANLMARGDQRARDAYGPNTSRLLAVKSHYDPDGVFAAIPLPE
jgi:Berberine and berberine like